MEHSREGNSKGTEGTPLYDLTSSDWYGVRVRRRVQFFLGTYRQEFPPLR